MGDGRIPMRYSLTKESEVGFHPDSLTLASQSYFNMVKEKEGSNYQSMGGPFYPKGVSSLSHSPNVHVKHRSGEYHHSNKCEGLLTGTGISGGVTNHSLRTHGDRFGGSGYGHLSFNEGRIGYGNQASSFTPRLTDNMNHRIVKPQCRVEPFSDMKASDLSPRMLENNKYKGGFSQATKQYRMQYDSIQYKSSPGEYRHNRPIFQGTPIHSTGKYLVNPLERHQFPNSTTMAVTTLHSVPPSLYHRGGGYYVDPPPPQPMPKTLPSDPNNMNKSPSLSILDIRNNHYKNHKAISQVT